MQTFEKLERKTEEPILSVRGLTKHFSASSSFFSRDKAVVKAVNNVSFDVYPGETLGIVGESGCGKTTLGRLLLHLEEPTSGKVLFDGKNVLECRGAEMRRLRRYMQMVYQDPYTSLNPRKTIGASIGEPLVVQKLASRDEIRPKVLEMLDVVGLSSSFFHRYPHECSGGQRQRVCIARALILRPKLIICDEAVSALDVSTQAQIINLLEDIQREYSLTYLFISHGLSVVRHISNRVIVMYLGQIMEFADAKTLYDAPCHPYSRALFSSIPIPNPKQKGKKIILEGNVPNPLNIPSGCAFHTRCSYAQEVCKLKRPELSLLNDGRYCACHFAKELRKGDSPK